MCSIVSVEVEAELTQIRDELYHRVSSAVLQVANTDVHIITSLCIYMICVQKCFYSQQQLASIARGGIITTTNAAATARNVDDNLREPSGEIDTPSISVIGYVIDIDDAIHVARHLGVKSDTCRRLYLTALLIRDLRRALQVHIGCNLYCDYVTGV